MTLQTFGERPPPDFSICGFTMEDQVKQGVIRNEFVAHSCTEKKKKKKNSVTQFLEMTKDLSEGGERILREPNAGGNSLLSEVLSFEFMYKTFGASLEKTEMEINYHSDSKKVDYSMLVGDRKYGVSVTRAFHFVDDTLFTEKEVYRILEKKLEGLVVATGNVVRKDKWSMNVLHVWVRSLHVAQLIQRVYNDFPQSLTSECIVMVTFAPTVTCIFEEVANDVDEIFCARGIPKPVYVRTYEDEVFSDEDFNGMKQVEMDLDELMSNEIAFDSEDEYMCSNEDLVDFYAL